MQVWQVSEFIKSFTKESVDLAETVQSYTIYLICLTDWWQYQGMDNLPNVWSI